MIKADIYFANSSTFYHLKTEDGKEVTGYEGLFLIIHEFKNKFNYTIHLLNINNNNEEISIVFKEDDYTIKLSPCGNRYYLILEASKDSIENFTERYNHLKEIMG
jgi:hypothetical protein